MSAVDDDYARWAASDAGEGRRRRNTAPRSPAHILRITWSERIKP